jgi:hypothetical protein
MIFFVGAPARTKRQTVEIPSGCLPSPLSKELIMGLDISAYSGIKKIDCIVNENGEAVDPSTREEIDYDTYFRAYVNDSFPGRADDIEHGACYSFNDSDGMRAGSYGGYNIWRDKLAELAGYPLGEFESNGAIRKSHALACWNGASGPFSELINFSDCDGIIGPSISKKLAKDFADYQSKANESRDEDFLKRYNDWRKMFELAADNGAVCFH